MSKTTKRKHVAKEVEDLSIPTKSQSIVKVIESRGNNLHEIVNSNGEQYLVSMPVKFRRHIWIKRGDFVLVEPIAEGDKVKAEIVKILTRVSFHCRFLCKCNQKYNTIVLFFFFLGTYKVVPYTKVLAIGI